MAKARLISRTLGTSRKFAALYDAAGKLAEFAQALYPLLVVNADDHGRQHGDAFTIKHAVWPTSHRSEAEFDRALSALSAVRLIDLYEVAGVIYLAIREFDEFQTGLHKRRSSKFPSPPNFSGEPTEKTPEQNRTEQKGTEQEPNRTPARREDDAPAEFQQFWAAYPRKDKRIDALKAWKQISPTEAELPLILSHIARARASPQWLKDKGEFIPLPASYLRQRRWEDQGVNLPTLSRNSAAALVMAEADVTYDTE